MGGPAQAARVPAPHPHPQKPPEVRHHGHGGEADLHVEARQGRRENPHDGRTIRYPPPAVKVHDVVKLDLESGKIVDSIKFDVGMTCMITKGRNTGRVGTIVSVEKHPGSFDIVAVRDASNHQFATRLSNIFIVGKDDDLQVSLPKGKGVKLSILEERKKRFKDKY